MSVPSQTDELRRLAAQIPGLRLLVLHGSRARGDTTTRSDWDFAFLGDASLDELELRSRLVGALHTDHLDLADLSRAGGLLRYRVAKDGRPVFESRSGEFEDFCIEAATFWLDIEPIVRAEHSAMLNALG